ncbi:MAG TPA: trypsin-like peptidase domain-containing protein [Thermodesulfovibrionales bacterium]|nr:trypsin-like peptidase domain-containing protein [Thermodesulfovibrionales bacterium]
MRPTSRMLVAFILSMVIALSISTDYVYARRDIPDDNLEIPVLFIGEKTAGSGFFYDNDKFHYFITARHVLFEDTSTTLEKIPEDLQIPDHLLYRVAYEKNKKQLIFRGVMSSHEKDELIKSASNNEPFRDAIEQLYKNSQRLKLKNNKATLLSYRYDAKTEINEIELEIVKLFNDGKIKYHPSIDVALIKIGTTVISGEKRSLDISAGAIKKKSAGITAIGTGSIKLYKDVLVGNTVYAFGYPVSVTNNPLLDVRAPLIRKGIVAGKNDKIKTIILDCPLHPGNSGGLVLEVEKVLPGGSEEYRAIGLVTNSIPFRKERKNREH